MNRRGWLTEISRDDWPTVKPELRERGDPNCPLIRMLINDAGYRRMYIEYLNVQRRLPTEMLLDDLPFDVADQIMRGVKHAK